MAFGFDRLTLRLAGFAVLALFALGAVAALPAGVTQGASIEGITEYTLAQRPARPVVPGRDQADGHRQRHVPRRVAPRELRRDGHGAPAGAPDVQGHADDGQHLPGARPPRDALQRHDVVRPHQLLRDLHRLRREPRLGARHGGRPHGQRVHREEGPRHRDDRGAQRVRERREQSRSRCSGAGCRQPRTTGTTTATRRSARARTSRTSTSGGCRRSTGATTSPTTRC